jgi:hypothetical protein
MQRAFLFQHNASGWPPQEPGAGAVTNRQSNRSTMWGPQDSVQLVYNSDFTMVYGTYNYS